MAALSSVTVTVCTCRVSASWMVTAAKGVTVAVSVVGCAVVVTAPITGTLLVIRRQAEPAVWLPPCPSVAVTTSCRYLASSAPLSVWLVPVAPAIAVAPVPALSLARYHW